MQRIESNIKVGSADFKENKLHMESLLKEFHEKQESVRYERPKRDMDRIKRQNKLFVRDRLDLLLDKGAPFLELSTLAACRDYDGSVPGAGISSGIGIIQGKEVVVIAGDGTVKGGAWFTESILKIVRALDIAIENRLPVVHICDSAGGFLPRQSDYFADRYRAGRIFRNQCVLSELGVPQLAIVTGHCTAGGAYVPALSDYSVIVRGTGAIFLGGPPLVKAATGEEVTVDALGGCDMHTQVSGTSDYPAGSEEEAIAIARDIVDLWSHPEKTKIERQTPVTPYYDPKELYGIVPKNTKVQFDIREVIARIVDDSRFHEYKPAYGTTLVCGFAHIWGFRVGILGNNGVLFNESSLKAANFMELCSNNKTPLIFLQNITGFMIGKQYEEHGITKNGAKMLIAQAGSTVPKFTVIVNRSYGAGNYGMCGRAWDARLLWMWPQSTIGVMGGEQAANTLTDVKVAQLKRQGKELSEEERKAIHDPFLKQYERESDAYHSTSNLWDDGILDPADTRNALGVGISCSLNAPFGNRGYGVFRM